MEAPATREPTQGPTRERRRIHLPALLNVVVLVGVFTAISIYEVASRLNRSPDVVGLHEITIPSGASAREVGRLLQRDGLIRSARFFEFTARLRGFDRRITAGTHWVNGTASTTAILQQLLSGGFQITHVTVPEGYTVRDIAHVIAANLPVSPDSFYAAARELAVTGQYTYGIAAAQAGSMPMEGFLYPSTYYFDTDASAHEVVHAMVREFHRMFTSRMAARADTLGMTVYEVVTLASIIEREAAVDSERPIISQVFHRRLKLHYPLGADPTVKYAMNGLTEDKARLSLTDIQVNSPYNTYRHSGLPPGPICNPGIKSIRAALWPAATNYLYFVSNWDGTHIFSRTLAKHAAAKQISHKRFREMLRAERMEETTRADVGNARALPPADVTRTP